MLFSVRFSCPTINFGIRIGRNDKNDAGSLVLDEQYLGNEYGLLIRIL